MLHRAAVRGARSGHDRSLRGDPQRRRHALDSRIGGDQPAGNQHHPLRRDRRHRGQRRLLTARRRSKGSRLRRSRTLKNIVDASAIDKLRFVIQERRYELREQILAGHTDPSARFASACRRSSSASEIIKALTSVGYTAVIALAISTMVATLLAQWMLRPIHVIQSGLTRLGRGELDVRLDLPGQEFADLGQLLRGGQRAARRGAQQCAAGSLHARPNSSRSWRISRMPSRCSRLRAS